MKRIILPKAAIPIAFICIAMNAHAQHSRAILKISPLAAADFISFPAIQGGVEFKLSKRLSWYNELGIKYMNGAFNKTDSSFTGSKGFKLKSEVRYYLQREGKRHFSSPGYYFAANAFFSLDHYNTEVHYYTNSLEHIDAFGIRKSVWGMNVLAGRQFAFYNRFMLDLYCGVGFRHRNISTSGEDYNPSADKLYTRADLNIPDIKADIDAKPGNSLAPNVTMGFRLGFQL